MRTVPLQQICDIQIGKTPSRSVPEYWGGELPWVTISDFAAGRIVTTTQERITRIGAAKSGSKRIPRGTLLLSFKLSLGKRALSGCDLFTNEAIAALHVLDHDVADRDYLYWALGSIDYDRLVDRAAKGKTLNKAKLKILKIPLPPLAEQKRIAAILDAADALRAKRREALAQLDTLLQSTFLDMFGDPVTNPMGWEIEGFDNWLDNIDSGWSPKCLNRKALIGEWGVLKLGAVTWCEFDDSDQKALPPSLAPRPELEVAPGDLLFTRKNTHDLVAAVAYVHKVRPRLMLSDLIFRLRLKSGIEIKPAFLWQLLIQPKQRQVIQKFAGGSAGSMPNISKTKLKTLKLIKPPLDLQHRFAAIVESVEQQKASQRTHLAELDTLFASLQSRAFRGDI